MAGTQRKDRLQRTRAIRLPALKRRVDSDSGWMVLLVDTSTDWGRRIVAGAVAFANRHTSWRVMVEARGIEERLHVPKGLNCSGVIARVSSKRLANELRYLNAPVVNVSTIVLPGVDFPRVTSDMLKVADLAFEHLRANGLSQFAYLSLQGLSYVRLQQDDFRARVEQEGYEFHHMSVPSHLGAEPDWRSDVGEIVTWLRSLPKPVGVVTWNASSAREVVYACLEAGILVPDEVSILSAAEDDLLCESSPIPISAVVPATRMIGFQAARLLHEMQSRRASPPGPIFIRPLQVVTRQSTIRGMLADAALVRALDYLRSTDPKRVTVEALARQAGLGRRVLERRFREVLHRSPLDEVRRARLDHARNLLAETQLPISTVADVCGFSTQSYFTKVFRTHMNMTPVVYRQHARPR